MTFFFFIYLLSTNAQLIMTSFVLREGVTLQQALTLHAGMSRVQQIVDVFKQYKTFAKAILVRYPFSEGMEFGANEHSPIEFDVLAECRVYIVCRAEPMQPRAQRITVLGLYAPSPDNAATTIGNCVRIKLRNLCQNVEQLQTQTNAQEEEEEEKQAESHDQDEPSESEYSEPREHSAFYIFNNAPGQRLGNVHPDMLHTYALKRVALLKSAMHQANAVLRGRSSFSDAQRKLDSFARDVFVPGQALAMDLDRATAHILCMAVAELARQPENKRLGTEWIARERFLFKCRAHGQSMQRLCKENGLDYELYTQRAAQKVLEDLKQKLKERKASTTPPELSAMVHSIKQKLLES